MKKLYLILLAVVTTLLLSILDLSVSNTYESQGFISSVFAQSNDDEEVDTIDPWGDDCTAGYCVQLCGYQMFLTACTYIDCGSGTQLCTRLRTSPYPPEN